MRRTTEPHTRHTTITSSSSYSSQTSFTHSFRMQKPKRDEFEPEKKSVAGLYRVSHTHTLTSYLTRTPSFRLLSATQSVVVTQRNLSGTSSLSLSLSLRFVLFGRVILLRWDFFSHRQTHTHTPNHAVLLHSVLVRTLFNINRYCHQIILILHIVNEM